MSPRNHHTHNGSSSNGSSGNGNGSSRFDPFRTRRNIYDEPMAGDGGGDGGSPSTPSMMLSSCKPCTPSTTNTAVMTSTPNRRLRNDKYKTTLCKYYVQTGRCPFRNRCHYMHGEEDFVPYGAANEMRMLSTGSYTAAVGVGVGGGHGVGHGGRTDVSPASAHGGSIYSPYSTSSSSSHHSYSSLRKAVVSHQSKQQRENERFWTKVGGNEGNSAQSISMRDGHVTRNDEEYHRPRCADGSIGSDNWNMKMSMNQIVSDTCVDELSAQMHRHLKLKEASAKVKEQESPLRTSVLKTVPSVRRSPIGVNDDTFWQSMTERGPSKVDGNIFQMSNIDNEMVMRRPCGVRLKQQQHPTSSSTYDLWGLNPVAASSSEMNSTNSTGVKTLWELSDEILNEPKVTPDEPSFAFSPVNGCSTSSMSDHSNRNNSDFSTLGRLNW